MIKEIIDGKNLEDLLQRIIYKIHKYGPIYDADLELLAYIKLFYPEIFAKYESRILYAMGLFYKVREPTNIFEETYAIFSQSIEEETHVKFSPIQADAYKKIHNKLFFSFSAPTSTGKSFLFRELIINAKRDIIIVVPSRALIAEYISSIKRLVDNEVLVLQFIENVNIEKTKRRIFVITPERGNDLFKYSKDFDIQIFLLDEAQISEEEVRGIKFDAFVRRISIEFPNANKVFTHPFILNPEAQLKKHKVSANVSSSSRYQQNTVGKIFISNDNDSFYFFSPYSEIEKRILIKDNIVEKFLIDSKTVLIYASKNKLYNKKYIREYAKYLKYCPIIKNPEAISYIEQLKDYIGAGDEGSRKNSLLISLMRRGIVIHHGSMPLKARLIIEDFVRANFVKICFATSTLKQGINMPFDIILLDNFRDMDTLVLKNLIGRAGRTTESSEFNYGYTIIYQKNMKKFLELLRSEYVLSETSELDNDVSEANEDNKDIIEAVKSNQFDDEYRLTKMQVERLKSRNIKPDILFILDNLLRDGKPITGDAYYELGDTKRNQIKESFKKIFTQHLMRKDLTKAEKNILSAAIPILLWHIQGKSFKEVVALRHYFLTRQKEQNELRKICKKGEISADELEERISQMNVRYTPMPSPLPNSKARELNVFHNTSVRDLDYDTLVFDTYDYIDKVVSLSLADPLCAAFLLYYNESDDERALVMNNYIRFATNDQIEIWLLKYGFSFEDIDWIKPCIESIDQNKIIFNRQVRNLNEIRQSLIYRYV